MRHAYRNLTVGALLLFGATACANLDVVNPNDADASRALQTSGDVMSLIGGGYNTWFQGVYDYNGPGLFLSNASFQHAAPWANAGMEFYARIPRQTVVNDAADSYYGNFTRPWYYSYRAIAGVASGLKALEDPDISGDLDPTDLTMAQAYGNLVLGIAHATIAVFYDQGFVVDQTTDVNQAQEAMPYDQLMQAAMGYFDKAIQLAGSSDFTLPQEWMAATVTSDDLVKIAHSLKARYRANVARTPEQRAAVDWSQVIADVNAGVTSSFNQYMDANNGWYYAIADYGTFPGWSEAPYWIYGMADQSGNYQRWLDLSIADKTPNPSGGPILIITPDQRFPQGSTVDEQRANPGTYYEAPSNIANVWARPDRGTWRWSYYHDNRYPGYYSWTDFNHNEIDINEMNLLKAEGLYRTGDKAGAAAIVNQTRTAAGLNATDANGTNTSCVPKLPNGQCGDLLEMLKWEKRIEVNFEGLFGAPAYFDSRGWGDLWYGTPLEFPAPCKELQVLQLLPCYTFGGPGGEMASPGSEYNWPHEQG